MLKEKEFPRGGVVSHKSTCEKKDTNILFGPTQKPLVKKNAKRKLLNVSNRDKKYDEEIPILNNEELVTSTAKLINYHIIEEGMLLMVMVKTVDSLFMEVSLPGGMSARISALNISDSYTRVMKTYLNSNNDVSALSDYKSLPELFRVGQLLYGKVKTIKTKENCRRMINLSIKPADIHSHLNHANIEQDFVFSGAIEEIQDHGYIIEAGIVSMRCFLPKENTYGRKYVLGEIINLKVCKVTTDKFVSTCICKSVRSSEIQVNSHKEIKLDYLLPSTIIKFTVTKILKDGLQGTIMNGLFTAYVNEHHLTGPLTWLSDFELMKSYTARLLYVMPMTKFVYLSLNMNLGNSFLQDEGNCLTCGDIIHDAYVHHMGTGGVILILRDCYKAILTYNTIKLYYKGNYDQDELMAKYKKKSLHTVRILDYDPLCDMYICSDNPQILHETYLTLNNAHCGDFVTATVVKRNMKNRGCEMKVGKLNGIIQQQYLAPISQIWSLNTKIRCRIVSLDEKHYRLCLTNRTEYMSEDCKILTTLDNAKVNETYMGTVVKTGRDNKERDFYLIKFFGDVSGLLYKKKNSFDKLNWLGSSNNLSIGQTCEFRIINKRNNSVVVQLASNYSFTLGEICSATILDNIETGFEIMVYPMKNANNKKNAYNYKGILPTHLLSDYTDLLRAKLKMYQTDDHIQVVSIHDNIFSLRDVNHFLENEPIKWKDLNINDVVRAFVKNVTGDLIEIMLPISKYNKDVSVNVQMVLMNVLHLSNLVFSPEQVIYVKILQKDEAKKSLSVSAKLLDVWAGKMQLTNQYCENYLNEVAEIRQQLQKRNDPLSRYVGGDHVIAEFQCVNEVTNDWEYKLENTEIVGVVKSALQPKNKCIPKFGTAQKCIVLWVDYSDNVVFLSNNQMDINHITSKELKLPCNLVGKSGIACKVLYKGNTIFVCSLKKTPGPFIYCPIKLHFNDFEQLGSVSVMEGQYTRVTFLHDQKPIAVFDNIYKMWCNVKKSDKSSKKVLKRHLDDYLPMETKCKKAKLTGKNIQSRKEVIETNKLCNEEPNELLNEIEVSDMKNNNFIYVDNKPDNMIMENLCELTTFEKNVKKDVKRKKVELKPMPGISGFWNTDFLLHREHERIMTSDDDDDEENSEVNEKQIVKKRLTATEKFKLQREEEDRLRLIEANYADPNRIPVSIDEFDRLILTDPNNSKHWISYMVFHLQSTEIDKARAVARRALKAISQRNSNDHINVWVALLNLELRYGSKDLFNETLKEAIILNDPLQIYLRAIDILMNAQKSAELIELISIVTKKFKSNPEVWKVAANALFTINMADKAQQMLHRALICLDERDHINTIVNFAILNNQHGYGEMAQTLLDQIVTSYPKRVDVWSQYVDMLVKANLIDSARNVLERAVLQKLPLKKMHTIYKKYLQFEERYGTPNNVERLKEQAVAYVAKSHVV